ncbi:hypothetical protein POF50_022510 [Streptomyces sp. SL13]|jgi:hypothetical protein|uniref:Uncharacterized protein n=1 Tax=Streptantibioticus silvisoli TaxID=2705255 RepID=A0AA90KHN1_9ACTN|nr:DUF6643 family protein [Streptantibioticus silvisoli]MDI5966724.1 hypothetical protein [Streptantibioticus silvisoli]MDI5972075.1 hypothetical protein [Streptantibioticus silvisoli]
MTTPRGTYGGGYYASSSFPDTPIYDSLVAERGTPQIAPIRVSLPSYDSVSNLPALPALPALPSGPSQPMPQQAGYPGQMPAAYPAQGYPQQVPAPYIPQQAHAPRGYQGNGYPAQAPGQMPYQGNTGYDAVRPVPPRPVPPRQPAPGGYPEDPYRRPYNNYNGQGY